jgi:hypothetical protein
LLSCTSHTNDAAAAAAAPAAADRHMHHLALIANMLCLLQKLLLRGVLSKIFNTSLVRRS